MGAVEVMDEGTVTWLGEARVPMANVGWGTYVDAEGASREGFVCSVVLADGPLHVGAGSRFEAGGVVWVVEEVARGDGGTGWCRVRSVEPGLALDV